MYIILLYISGLLGRKDCDIVQILEMTVDVEILILGRCFQYKSKVNSKIKCFQYETEKNLKKNQFQVLALFSKELIKKHVSHDATTTFAFSKHPRRTLEIIHFQVIALFSQELINKHVS